MSQQVLRNRHCVKLLHASKRIELENDFEMLTDIIKKHNGAIHGCQYIGYIPGTDQFEMAIYYDIPGSTVENFNKAMLGIKERLES